MGFINRLKYAFKGDSGMNQTTGTAQLNTSLTPQELMQVAMNDAMALTETTEDAAEKIIFEVLAMVSYVVPFLLAWLVGFWIGDGLAAFMKVKDTGLYDLISITIEMTVPVASVTCARAVKRIRSDSSVTPLFVVGVLWFVCISVGSALTQWVILTNGYNTIPGPLAIVALFRGIAPILADLICATFLALHGYKSLKRRLAQLDERAEAVTKIYTRQNAIEEQSSRLQKEREDAEADRKRRDKSQEVLNRIQEVQATAAISAIESLLGNQGGNGNNKQNRF